MGALYPTCLPNAVFVNDELSKNENSLHPLCRLIVIFVNDGLSKNENSLHPVCLCWD